MKSGLDEQIRSAFRDTVFPGEEEICDSLDSFEAQAVKRAFHDKTSWNALDSTFLDSAPDGLGSALNFFSAAAFQFYLPAYLLADMAGSLEFVEPDFSLCYIFNQLCFKDMSKEQASDQRDHFYKRNEVFNAAQSDAIVGYLRFVQRRNEDPMVERALSGYWVPKSQGNS